MSGDQPIGCVQYDEKSVQDPRAASKKRRKGL